MAADERDLVAQFQRGGGGSLRSAYAGYGDRIYRLLSRLCGHAADAGPGAGGVRRRLPGRDRFAGRPADHLALSHRLLSLAPAARRASLKQRVLDSEMNGDVTAPPIRPGHVERLVLEDALGRLPVTLREAFLLVKAEGLKYREAAQVLGVPQGTVQSRVHDAVVRLRILLADDEDSKDGAPGAAVCRCAESGRAAGGETGDAMWRRRSALDRAAG